MIPTTRKGALALGEPFYSTGKPCKHGHISERRTSNGRCEVCRKTFTERKNEYMKKYVVENKEKLRLYKKGYREKNKKELYLKEKGARDPIKTRVYHRQYNREYRENNRPLVNFWAANRRSAEKQRTPPWLTEEHFKEIAAFYVTAKELTESTGMSHHVDHIVPLQGELVSGLHVPWNLQVLTAVENLRKSNRFEVAA